MARELTPVRVRPAIRRIAIWVTPVLLLIAAWQIWDAIEARRLEEALAPVAGPSTPMEIKFSRMDDGAARYYAAASVFVAWGDYWKSVQLAPRGPLVDATGAFRDAITHGSRPPEPLVIVTSQQLERGRAVFDLLAQASPLAFSHFSPGTEFNYRSFGLQTIDRLAGLKTLDLALNEQGDAAAQVLYDRLKFSRVFDDRLFSQWWKARAAQESATDLGVLVGRATPSEERLVDLDRALSEMYPANELERSIRGAVFWMSDEIRSIWEGRAFGSRMGPLLRPIIRHHLVDRLQTSADALAAARLPWPDRIRAMNQVRERESILPQVTPIFGAWRVASEFRDATVRMGEALVAIRCARLVIGIERFRKSHKQTPATLNDIVEPNDDLALDPFTGKALLYKREATGYVIYSVGRDGVDEGGTFSTDLPRWGEAKIPPTDVGVRVQRLAPGSSRLGQP